MVAIAGVATKLVCSTCERRLLMRDDISWDRQVAAAGWDVSQRPEGGFDVTCAVCAAERLTAATLLATAIAGGA